MLETAKKLAFGLGAAAALLLLIEGALAAVGVVPLFERADPYVGFSDYAPLFHENRSPSGQAYYETAPNKVRWFNVQRFPARKASGTTRIFCLGGSTTYGRPYDDRTSFAGWLRAFLPRVDPGRQWEVVNAGGISYASYRVARIMEELAGYEPDLFIVYSGHNEFLERRTYDRMLDVPEVVRDLGALASRLRIYSVLYDALDDRRDVLPAEVKPLLDRSVGPDDYERDDAMRRVVLEHYRTSLRRMTAIAERAGAEVLLVTPASNIEDFSPFKSEPGPGLADAALRRTQNLRDTAAAALDQEQPERALAAADEALALDNRNADLHYLRGEALNALGRTDEARDAYIRARNEDVCPLRAPSSVRTIVRDVARNRDVAFIDYVQLVRRQSPDGIPGSELFLDHVHPTIEGNRLLALAIIRRMAEEGFVSPVDGWNESAVGAVAEQHESGLDEEAHAAALRNLSRVLMWAGKDREAERLLDQAAVATADDGEIHLQRGKLAERSGNLETALEEYRKAAELAPWNATVQHSLGVVLSDLGFLGEARKALASSVRLDPTRVEAHYDLGLVLERLGQSRQAEIRYRKVLEMDPTHADAHNNLGVVLAKRGDIAAAFEEFAEAARLDPDHASAVANLERAKRVLGR